MAKPNSEVARRVRLCQDQQVRRRTSTNDCPKDQQVGKNSKTDIFERMNDISRKVSTTKSNHIITYCLFALFLIMAITQLVEFVVINENFAISIRNAEMIYAISVSIYLFITAISGIFAFIAISSGLTFSVFRFLKKAKRQA